MPDREPLIDWSEILAATRGTKQWRKGVAFTCQVCTLLMLPDLEERVVVGAGNWSWFELYKPASPRPQITLWKRLLDETAPPRGRLDLRLSALGCVLAHEMAHYRLVHRSLAHPRAMEPVWNQTARIPISQKRNVLSSLNAHMIAKWIGCRLSDVEQHWAVTEAEAQGRHIDAVADEIDSRAIQEPRKRLVQRGDLKQIRKDARADNADEWLAATVGFLMFHRLNRGPDFVARLVNNFEGLADWGGKDVLEILELPTRQPDAEVAAEGLTNRLLRACGDGSKSWDRIPGLRLVRSSTLRCDVGRVSG